MTANCKPSSSQLATVVTCIVEMNLNKIDRLFLVQTNENVDFEEELAGTRN